MDYAAVVTIEVLSAIASLMLISMGLSIIFGMMKVINLAHGEFLMLGGYSAITATKLGINVWISMLLVAPVVVAAIGVIVERFIIRHLYGRMVDTMLATWGLSLLLIGLVTAAFGNTTEGIASPLGAMSIGRYKVGLYPPFIVAVALVLALGVYLVLRHTSYGLVARGTMQNANMAAALGMEPSTVYAITFAAGAAVTGMAGGVLAPISGIVPTMGLAYVAKAFITVIGGGTAILAGTASASALFGTINQLASFATTPVFGEVALSLSAIVLVRLLPQGITGRFFRKSI